MCVHMLCVVFFPQQHGLEFGSEIVKEVPYWLIKSKIWGKMYCHLCGILFADFIFYSSIHIFSRGILVCRRQWLPQ